MWAAADRAIGAPSGNVPSLATRRAQTFIDVPSYALQATMNSDPAAATTASGKPWLGSYEPTTTGSSMGENPVSNCWT